MSSPASSTDPLAPLSPSTRAWFEGRFTAASPVQALGWPAIAAGKHALLLAPTGSGKTLAACLSCLDRLIAGSPSASGVQLLYVSPLKALSRDVHLNLELPLAGITAEARARGLAPPLIELGLRTGDTPQRERARQLRHPPAVLVTTPESLYLLLTSRARATLATTRWVIVDEIHALAGNKRGAHLALSLERLEALVASAGSPPPVRIGLSATQRPLQAIARYLGGVGREVTLVDPGGTKALEVQVEALPAPSPSLAPSPSSPARVSPEAAVGKWVSRCLDGHRSTLVFVNDRRAAERVCASLNESLETARAQAHHGAMSRAAREQVEAALKAGTLPALVCTSSLELGIDVGAIDQVVQVGSPGSVARGLQRIGRAGHLLGATSHWRLLARSPAELLECAAVVGAMRAGQIERTRIPERCLDVLAQQVVAMCAVEPFAVDELLALLRRSWPYRGLERAELEAVLEMLSGRLPSELVPSLPPRIVWDRAAGPGGPSGPGGIVRGRAGALRVAVTSGGTIPDKGLYPVELGPGGPRLGELDEEFIHESRVGDVFQLGTGTWRIVAVGANAVTVAPAPGEPARLPFWRGDGPGRSVELGEAVGALCRRIEEDGEPALDWLTREHGLVPEAAAQLSAHLQRQRAATGFLPTDRRVVVERFTDALGDLRLAIHCPLGERVLVPLGLLLAARLTEATGAEPSWVAADDGLLFRLAATEAPPSFELRALVADLVAGGAVERALVEALERSSLFAARFRENAARALLLPRRMPGRRTPLYLQRLRARDLLEAARHHPDFPVLVETYRECLRDAWDTARLHRLMEDLGAGRVEVIARERDTPSPFAASLLFRFVQRFLYQGESPRAERRAQLLPLGGALLQGLLDAREHGELYDPAVREEESARAARLRPQDRARDPDQLHDRLLQLGPLALEAVAVRLIDPGLAPLWLQTLEKEGRVLRDGPRFIAAEDAPRLAASRAGDLEATRALLGRALRAGGPASVEELAARAALDPALAGAALAELEAEGAAVRGWFREGEDQPVQLIDRAQLERLHRRSLAAARRAIRPVPRQTYQAFLTAWQHLAPAHRLEGPLGLDRALTRLAGFPIPAELLERELLARRVRRLDPSWLDRSISDGAWAFRCEAGSASRPRALFFSRPDLGPATVEPPVDPVEAQVVRHLSAHGASFFSELYQALELGSRDLQGALWTLLVRGVVSNDRWEAVRRGPSPPHPDRAGRPDRGRRRAALRPSALAQGGRWSLAGAAPIAPGWWAEQLLHRYGVVSRAHLEAERLPVGWGELCEIWRQLERLGRVRSGYFVEELPAPQWAWPEAVERLRQEQVPATLLASACDPVLSWQSGELVLARLPSNFAVLHGGRAALLIELAARRLRIAADLSDNELQAACAALATLGGVIELEELDGKPALDSPLEPRLLAVGFERDGERLRRSPLIARPLDPP